MFRRTEHSLLFIYRNYHFFKVSVAAGPLCCVDRTEEPYLFIYMPEIPPSLWLGGGGGVTPSRLGVKFLFTVLYSGVTGTQGQVETPGK